MYNNSRHSQVLKTNACLGCPTFILDKWFTLTEMCLYAIVYKHISRSVSVRGSWWY